MKNKNLPSDFQGFDDFVELFKSGTHTDHAGRTSAWSNDVIDQIIANHNAADAAPIVIGHPKDDASSFAYGWVDQLKRDGDTLLGKFKQVDSGFERLVKDGNLKNRSIRILKGANGFKLGHVGWLGASPAAVSGLQPVQFSSADEVFDFSVAEWRPTGIMARMMRNMREFLITQFGQEKADSVLSNYDIDELNRLSEQQYQEEQAEQGDSSGLSSFSSPQQDDVMAISQADVDAAKKQASEAEQKASDFATQNQTLVQQLADERSKNKRAEFQAIVAGHLQRGVKPAVLEGAADFMLNLDSEETGVFEFSVGDGSAKKSSSQIDFVKNLLQALPVSVKPGAVDFSGDVKPLNTVGDITKAAQEFQFSESQAGRTISVADAVAFVTQGATNE